MLVQRQVFDKMREHTLISSINQTMLSQKHFDGSRYIHAYFDTVIDDKDSPTAQNEYLSEDYMFCQMRKISKVFLCP